jgi:hypothetical protein
MAFGKIIPNLEIYGKPAPYPVVNDRDVRAAAGLMFLLASIAFSLALLTNNYLLLKITVLLFTLEFLLRVIDPRFAPFYALGALLVKNQTPDYSGAVQKRFAWSLGLGLAGVMTVVVHILNIQGILPFTICLICLSLLWLETALRLCVGCKIYGGLIRLNIINPKIRAACPGNLCSLDGKQ